MKNLLLAILAFFMMFLGTAYAGALPTMGPVYVTSMLLMTGMSVEMNQHLLVPQFESVNRLTY